MKALLYLDVRLFKNTILATLMNPRQVIPALFIITLLAFPMATLHTLDIPPMVSPYTSQTAKPVIFSFLIFITWMTIIHSTTKNTLTFSLSEIDFLFPSPLKRKTILLNRMIINYLKLMSQYFGIIAFMLFFFSSIYHFSYWRRVLFLWTALSLAMIFASNLGGMISLISSHLSELKRSRNRNILIVLFVSFLGILLGYISWDILQGIPLLDAVTKTLNSSFARILMYPLAAASDVAVSWTLTTSIAVKMLILLTLCLGTTWGVLSVETHFYEASEASSRELWESLEKMRRQEVVVSESFAKRVRKIEPFGSRATALVWKNLVGVLRDVRTLMSTFFMAIFLFVLMFVRESESGFFSVLFFPFFLVFITTSYIRWDFREDLRRIEIIKLIPDSNLRIVLSEIAVPVAVSTCISTLFLVVSFIIFPDAESKTLLTGFTLAALPLFSLIMVTISNLSTLYYPPQTNSQVVPGILSLVFAVIVLTPSLLLGGIFLMLEKMEVGFLLVLLFNVIIVILLLKLLERKYRIFDLTST